MKKIIIFLLFFLTTTFADITVLCDRTEKHIKPIIEMYKKENPNSEIKVIFAEEGSLETRVKTRNDFDIILTQDLTQLEPLKPYLVSFKSNSKFMSKDSKWAVLSYRCRVFFVDNGTSEFLDYQDVNKYDICIRPLTHSYNVNLVAQMIHEYGLEYAKTFVKNLKNNIKVFPQGNDRNQAKFNHERLCNLSIMNSYYFKLMENDSIQKEWIENKKLVFPDQNKKGSYAIYSGIAVKNYNDEVKKFIDFLYSKEVTNYTLNTLFEFSINEKNKYKVNFINPDEVYKYKKTAYEILK